MMDKGRDSWPIVIGVIMNHIFNVDVAKEYGILEAVMLNNFAFWIAKNEANEKHFHDGKYWTYNSTKAFSELYPYATPKQIRSALEHLRNEGLLETGNYNERKFDRTLWYTLSPKGVAICQQGISHLPNLELPFAPQGEAIPYINTDINTDINHISLVEKEKIPYREIIEYLNQVVGTSYKYTSQSTKEKIHARWEEGFRMDDFKKVIDNKAADWMNDKERRKYLRPETLFSPKFEGYLNQPMKQPTTKDLAGSMDFSGFADFD